MKTELETLINNPEKGVQKNYDIITESGEILPVPISRIRDNAIISFVEDVIDHLMITVKDDWSI